MISTETSKPASQPQRQPRPVYLEDPSLDKLARAVIELTAQLYISRDRERALERLLVDKGILQPGELDYYKGDTALQAQLEKEREALIEAVITRNLFED